MGLKADGVECLVPADVLILDDAMLSIIGVGRAAFGLVMTIVRRSHFMKRARVTPLLVICLTFLLTSLAGCDRDADDESSSEVEDVTQQAEPEREEEATSDGGDRADEESDDETASAQADEDKESSENASEDGDKEELAEASDGEEENADEAEEEEQAVDQEADQEDDIGSASLERDVSDLPFYATGPVATVDGEEVSADEFNMVVELQIGAMAPEAVEAQGDQLKEMILQGLVAAFLIEREIENQSIEVDESDIDEMMMAQERMLLQQFGGDRQQMEATMEQQGVDETLMREQVERELAAEKLVSESSSIEVSEQELRQQYQQIEAQLQQPEQARARHILLHVDDEAGNSDEVREQALGLAEQLEDSTADFAELAEEHSDCPTASQGGDLGYFTRDQLMPEFTEVAFEIEPGTISEPVRSNLGWHVMRVEDRRDEGAASFEEVRDELEMMAQAQKMQEAAAGLVQRLQENADIELKSDNIVSGGG